ncbi:MAG TPA: hypothetical protein VEL51_09725 [Vicinamibacterales bacterium]|nr:hypothetical protein [Vicinamibacterales bacterium]
MVEISALQKYPCPACGAQAEWNPGKQKLVCPFCGTESPYKVTATGEIEELDLVRALREMPEDARGWQTERRTVQCQSCKAVSVFEPDRVGQRCEFCGSPALVPYEEIKSPIRPQSLLAFRVADTAVREQIRRWYKSKWLAPGALKSRALVDTVKGVYIPYWTFDAHAECPWEAEAGHYFYTTETYRDDKGHTQTRQVQHVRWEPASGVVNHFFDDEPIPGTRGVDHALLRQVEPFPTNELVAYDTSYLSGFIVEHYQVVLLEAAQASEAAMHEKLEALCAAQVPGDTYRNLVIHPTFSAQTFKHILVPIWLLTYTYGARVFHVLVNGATGRMAGEYPKSFWKVFFLVVGIIILVLLVLLMQGEH